MSYLVHINGHPGVGKLTVGELLKEHLGARILDNHSVYNIALSLTEFKSETYFDTVRAVREIAYARILDLPKDIPVILTNAHFQDSKWGHESWERAISLSIDRGVPHMTVLLNCSKKEMGQRIQGESRQGKRKAMSLDIFSPNSLSRRLIEQGDHLLSIDTTKLCAEETAVRISNWINNILVI